MNATDRVEWFTRLVFGLVGLVHLIPAAGVLGRGVLQRAYGVQLPVNDLVIVLQHRGVLFGVLGLTCLAAVLHPHWRIPAGGIALASMLSFVALAALQTHGDPIARVMLIDMALVPGLLLALVLGQSR